MTLVISVSTTKPNAQYRKVQELGVDAGIKLNT